MNFAIVFLSAVVIMPRRVIPDPEPLNYQVFMVTKTI